jgi:hypothetical protein
VTLSSVQVLSKQRQTVQTFMNNWDVFETGI